MGKNSEPKKYVVDYWREVQAAGGELRDGNILYAESRLGADYLKKHGPKSFYYLIVSPKSGDEYAGFLSMDWGRCCKNLIPGTGASAAAVSGAYQKLFTTSTRSFLNLSISLKRNFRSSSWRSSPRLGNLYGTGGANLAIYF